MDNGEVELGDDLDCSRVRWFGRLFVCGCGAPFVFNDDDAAQHLSSNTITASTHQLWKIDNM
jgi:hypothetical protein